MSETAAAPAAEEWYCPACGKRYPAPGFCTNQHPAEALKLVADDAPADGEAGAVSPLASVTIDTGAGTQASPLASVTIDTGAGTQAPEPAAAAPAAAEPVAEAPAPEPEPEPLVDHEPPTEEPEPEAAAAAAAEPTVTVPASVFNQLRDHAQQLRDVGQNLLDRLAAL